MINQSTTTKLREMHLSAMAEAFQDQIKDPSHKELSFEERFGLLVDAEWTSRKHNRLQKLINPVNAVEPSPKKKSVAYIRL